MVLGDVLIRLHFLFDEFNLSLWSASSKICSDNNVLTHNFDFEI